MRISLQVLAYNVNRTLNLMLNNAAPHVDKIFIAYPLRAWDYRKDYMNTSNATDLNKLEIKLPCEVEIIKGEWKRDEDTRNSLLLRAREENYDWMIIQDADEFYTKESWEKLKDRLHRIEENNPDYIQVPYFTFWKSPSFILKNGQEGIKNGTTTFALNCKRKEVFFAFSRTTTGINYLYVDEPCYHYSYVLSDEEVYEKINSWAHTADMISKRLWFNLKWKRWHPGTKMLHPGSPWLWQQAVRFPLPQPEFAAEIIIREPVHADLNIFWASINWLYDLTVRLLQMQNGAKRLIRATFFTKGIN